MGIFSIGQLRPIVEFVNRLSGRLKYGVGMSLGGHYE